ncbi:hypothetical protein T03_16702 [Trichinella britovi]|uniref:HTH psq-type domain-containing protein n=1 Tax=Trichinella britovi TaxID=45882 RepID=A0A0V1CBR6_TRIBR|nr:hypothetical protein T03_16702 [Trichinella britovi]
MEKKEWRQITTAQKLQIIQTVDENPNMKRIDIARMMKIPSSRTLSDIFASFVTSDELVNAILSKQRNRLNLEMRGDLRLKLTNFQPNINALAAAHQTHPSH